MLQTSTNFRSTLSSLVALLLAAQLAVFENQASPFGAFQHHQARASTDEQKLHPSATASTSNQQQQQQQQQLSNRYSSHELRLYKLTSDTAANATCNDGSPAGYYMRLNKQSKRWIIYLQGGFFCSSEETCRDRWLQNPELMSSNQWAEFKTVNGMLSNDPKENPYLWNANHIFVPYCTSDAWTGQQPASPPSTGGGPNFDSTNSSPFSFMGSAIVRAVLESLYQDLPLEWSLYQSRYILLAGDSAGALGVMLNLDRVVEHVSQKSDSFRKSKALECSSSTHNNKPSHCFSSPKPAPVVRGLADSGWFLDKEHTSGSSGDSSAKLRDRRGMNDQDEQEPASITSRSFSALDYMRQAFFQWNARIPDSCAEKHAEEPWRCYFGYLSYTTLKTPLFVVQWLYDEVQFIVDNMSKPRSSSGIIQWDSGEKVLDDLRGSLENVTALFAPSCFSHSLVIKPSWNQINVNGFKLPYVLDKWEERSMQQAETNDEHASEYNMNKSRSNEDAASFVRQSTQGGRFRSANELFTAKQSQSPAPNNRHAAATGSTNQSNRPGRTRKRKRNNNQRPKQVRVRSGPMGESAVLMMNSDPLSYQTSDPPPSPPSSSTSSPLQDLLPLVDVGLTYHESISLASSQESSFNSNPISSINPRPSRSTYEDPVMVANQMPDDSSIISSSTGFDTAKQQDSRWSSSPVEMRNAHVEESTGGGFRGPVKQLNEDAAFFRLIDSCRTPQCNRNCPLSEMDFELPKII